MGSPMDLLGAGTQPVHSIVCFNFFEFFFVGGSKIGFGLKHELYIDNLPTSVVRLFEFIKNHHQLQILNYFRIREPRVFSIYLKKKFRFKELPILGM
jgi:hypothetical protein